MTSQPQILVLETCAKCNAMPTTLLLINKTTTYRQCKCGYVEVLKCPQCRGK